MSLTYIIQTTKERSTGASTLMKKKTFLQLEEEFLQLYYFIAHNIHV